MIAQTARVDNNLLEIIVFPRKTDRSYLWDYHAYLRNKKSGEIYAEGNGTNHLKQIAKNKAIYEAIERYCGRSIHQNRINASFHSLNNDNMLNPTYIIGFNDRQYRNSDFPFVKFNKNMKVEWVEGESLVNKRKVWIPAFSIYLGYNSLINRKSIIGPNSSVGLSVYNSYEKAIIKGIFEVVERDAAMITWLFSREVPRVNLNEFKSLSLVNLIDNIHKEGLEIEVGIMSFDYCMPSTVAILFDPQKGIPFASFGFSTNYSLELSIEKSIEEALLIRSTLETLKKRGELVKLRREKIATLLDHAIYYAYPSNRKFWNFLLRGRKLSRGQIKNKFNFKNRSFYENLDKVITIFKDKKQDVLWVDLTNNVAKKMKCVCVKVIIPNMQPVDFSYSARLLATLRIQELVKVKKMQLTNRAPHPIA